MTIPLSLDEVEDFIRNYGCGSGGCKARSNVSCENGLKILETARAALKENANFRFAIENIANIGTCKECSDRIRPEISRIVRDAPFRAEEK